MKQANRTVWAAAVCTAILGTVTVVETAGQQRTIPIEGYAAKVNDRVIMVSEVMAMGRMAEQRLRSTLQGAELNRALAEAYEEALESLISRELILEEYEEKEGQLPQQAVEDHMAQVLAERFDNDRSALLKALQSDHLSYQDWRKQIEEQLVITIMRRDAVMDKVSISPNAARERYEARFDEYHTPAQVKVRMITVGQGETEEEKATQASRIKRALERIESGERFDHVARELSEGSKAKNGGDWGWLPSSDLREELAKVVDQLETGHLSRIVAAGESYYLILVEDRNPEIVVSLSDVREELEREIRQEETARIHDEWTQRLRKKHFVKVY